MGVVVGKPTARRMAARVVVPVSRPPCACCSGGVVVGVVAQMLALRKKGLHLAQQAQG